MSETLSVSWPTLRDWCDLDAFHHSGAFVRGGNGIEWEFDPRKTVDVLLQHFRELVANEAERNAPSLKAQGLDTTSTSIVEAGRLLQLTNAVEEARRRSGITSDTREVAGVIERFAQLGARFSTIGARIDPTGQLDPALRRRIDQVGEEMHWEYAEQAEAIAEDFSAGTDAG